MKHVEGPLSRCSCYVVASRMSGSLRSTFLSRDLTKTAEVNDPLRPMSLQNLVSNWNNTRRSEEGWLHRKW